MKEIIQYLPYDLPIEILNYQCDYVGIRYSKANGYYMLNNEIHITYDGGSTGKSLSDFKPILRPLYDKDTDYSVFLMDNFPEELWCDAYTEIIRGIGLGVKVNQIPYELFEMLLQNYFDVFGLIEKGLAIDINTLEK